MEGFLAAQVDDAAVVEPAVRLPKEFLSEKNAGCKLHPLDASMRIVSESVRRSFGTYDWLLKSIALVQTHWMSLALFLRCFSDDCLGCKMQDTNPSWPAFFGLLRQPLL
jgi:hypothetical protein